MIKFIHPIIVEKPRPLRTQMLLKYKQEKQMKKELEMKMKKPPFYVGSKKSQLSSLQQNDPFLKVFFHLFIYIKGS